LASKPLPAGEACTASIVASTPLSGLSTSSRGLTLSRGARPPLTTGHGGDRGCRETSRTIERPAALCLRWRSCQYCSSRTCSGTIITGQGASRTRPVDTDAIAAARRPTELRPRRDELGSTFIRGLSERGGRLAETRFVINVCTADLGREEIERLRGLEVGHFAGARVALGSTSSGRLATGSSPGGRNVQEGEPRAAGRRMHAAFAGGEHAPIRPRRRECLPAGCRRTSSVLA
jgi:hypothetical protein